VLVIVDLGGAGRGQHDGLAPFAASRWHRQSQARCALRDVAHDARLVKVSIRLSSPVVTRLRMDQAARRVGDTLAVDQGDDIKLI
jgi:hypothetical protein